MKKILSLTLELNRQIAGAPRCDRFIQKILSNNFEILIIDNSKNI